MGAQTRTRHFEVGVPLLSIPGQGADPDMGMRQWHLQGRSSSRNARLLGLKLSLKQRLLFAEGANCVHLGAVPFPLQGDILPSPLEPLGFRQEAFFPYSTPDGKSASGGVAYLRDAEGNTIRLPVTPWEDEVHRILWDWLSWGTPLPLFNVHELFARPNATVFILPTEKDVDWLRQNAVWLASQFPLTTWPGGLQETLRDAGGCLHHGMSQ